MLSFGGTRKVLGGVLLALLVLAPVFLGLAHDKPPVGPEPPKPEPPKMVIRLIIIKFHDVDADGFYDLGEPRLSGWRFLIGGVGIVTTGPDGRASVELPGPGMYLITEQVPENWEVTTGNPRMIWVLFPGTTIEVYFGNKPVATPDLGDAPDSTNSYSRPMTAYPGVTARFPTVFAGSPPGPKHWEPREVAWLGPGVSYETEADTGPDEDGVPNINPPADIADQDGDDDGLLLPDYLPRCGEIQLRYYLNTAGGTAGGKPTLIPLYLNIWMDYNRDGDWEDDFPCARGTVYEWVVQNLIIPEGTSPGWYSTPLFPALNVRPGWCMWVRITLSEVPAPLGPRGRADGRGPIEGYKCGETEDYHWRKVAEPPPKPAQIHILKFEDTDGDGIRDDGEPLLSGWQFTVTPDVGTVTTDANGQVLVTVPPGTYVITELPRPNWLSTTPTIQTVTVGPGGYAQVLFGNRPVATADLGDAPDSTNSYSSPMTAYFNVPARFPTVFADSPPGPKHWQPQEIAWLGPEVSYETEADTGPDEDGVTNINPAADTADQDGDDDGLSLPEYLPRCGEIQLRYYLSTAGGEPTLMPLYLNLWLDYNRDGDWEDDFPCARGTVYEWVVQNLIIPEGTSPGSYLTPPFLALNVRPGWCMWVRITLSEVPAPLGPRGRADGRGPIGGYKYGETEDYHWRKVEEPPPKEEAQINILKFEDTDGDGVRDDGEPLLAGWQFAVIPGVGTVTTDANGQVLVTVPPGTYAILELSQPNWFSTTLPIQTVTVGPGGYAEVWFGNRREGFCDLAISKRSELRPDPPRVIYYITVTNVGTGACPSPTVVTETIPPGLTYVSATGANWSFAVTPTEIVCTYLDPILPGQSVTITIVFEVTGPVGDQIQNCVSVINCRDVNPDNNVDCDTLFVR